MIQARETHMRHLMPLLAAAALVLSTAPAYADLGDQLAKLLPDDGAGGDLFGWSVAISASSLGVICTDPDGPPDFDADATVAILDLLTMLANWGQCA